SFVHRFLDRASRLVLVAAIVEFAISEELLKFRETVDQIIRVKVQYFQLPQSRRVCDPSPEAQRNKLRSRRRMPTFVGHISNFAGLEVQARMDCIEQARLADAAGTYERRNAILDRFTKWIDPMFRLCARLDHAITQGFERSNGLFDITFLRQV